jgi:hypothetical protein
MEWYVNKLDSHLVVVNFDNELLLGRQEWEPVNSDDTLLLDLHSSKKIIVSRNNLWDFIKNNPSHSIISTIPSTGDITEKFEDENESHILDFYDIPPTWGQFSTSHIVKAVELLQNFDEYELSLTQTGGLKFTSIQAKSCVHISPSRCITTTFCSPSSTPPQIKKFLCQMEGLPTKIIQSQMYQVEHEFYLGNEKLKLQWTSKQNYKEFDLDLISPKNPLTLISVNFVMSLFY